MAIRIYDVDGTLIDSTRAVRKCQVDGLVRATEKDASKLEALLEERGLKGALQDLKIDPDDFFKKYYKTFDVYEAKKKGEIVVFPDAQEALQSDDLRLNFAISNSEIGATRRKLDTFDISKYFINVFAEFEKEKFCQEKPSYTFREILKHY